MSMTPREIVHELDRHIVGQNAAKRAVSIALPGTIRAGTDIGNAGLPLEIVTSVT